MIGELDGHILSVLKLTIYYGHLIYRKVPEVLLVDCQNDHMNLHLIYS